MFRRIRRYLAFLIVFAFSTTSLSELGVLVDDGSLEAAQIEQSGIDQLAVAEDILTEESVEGEAEGAVKGQEEGLTGACDQEWTVCDQDDELERRIEAESFYDTSLEFVSYYVHKYQKLPPVYMTKKEASQLGWIGGGLGTVTDKKSIGGDYFGNYQGLLPQKAGRSYHECDIDTLGMDSRGTKRLVYSNDGLMYYTDDHYETFQLLYSQWDSENRQLL